LKKKQYKNLTLNDKFKKIRKKNKIKKISMQTGPSRKAKASSSPGFF